MRAIVASAWAFVASATLLCCGSFGEDVDTGAAPDTGSDAPVTSIDGDAAVTDEDGGRKDAQAKGGFCAANDGPATLACADFDGAFEGFSTMAQVAFTATIDATLGSTEPKVLVLEGQRKGTDIGGGLTTVVPQPASKQTYRVAFRMKAATLSNALSGSAGYVDLVSITSQAIGSAPLLRLRLENLDPTPTKFNVMVNDNQVLKELVLGQPYDVVFEIARATDNTYFVSGLVGASVIDPIEVELESQSSWQLLVGARLTVGESNTKLVLDDVLITSSL